MRKFIFLSTVFLATSSFGAELPELQVTATRVEVPVEHVGDDVEVITQEEIKKYGFTSVVDVLKYVAGVHVSSTGGWGKQTSLFMLGLDSRDILVLVNGIPVNDPSNPNGAANFEWLDLNNVERIEVLKGSQSSLYGSEAVAGVINIITKKPKKNQFSFSLEGGKYKTFKEHLYSAFKLRNGYFAFSGENFKTNGFSAANEKAGKYIFDPDNDPFHYTTGTVSFGYSPNEKVRLTGSFLLKGGYSDYDKGRTDYDRYFATLGCEIVSSDSLVWEFKFGNNKEVRKETWGGYYNGITRYFLLSPTYFVSEKTFLKGGFSYRQEKADAVSFPNVDNKGYFIRSLFLEGHTELYGLSLTAVGRFDDHKEFGSHGTYKVSAAYNIGFSGTVLKAQYGTGFKAPTLSQLYGYYNFGGWTTVGNPDLKPEKSEGWILGAVQDIPFAKGKVEVNYFKNRVWDVIDSYYDSTLKATTYRNEDKAITEGIEVKGNLSLTKALGLFGSYTHLRAKKFDKTANSWKEMERRPKESFILGLRTNFKRFSFSFWAEHYGSRKDKDYSSSPAKEVTLPSFTTYDCYASYQLNDRVNFYIKGVNLTDKNYELAYGYNTMGRALFTGINFTF